MALQALLTAFLLLCARPLSAGDKVVLRSGKTYTDCEAEVRQDGFIIIHTEHGQLGVASAYVQRIIRDVRSREECRGRREKLDPTDAQGLHQVALFCKEQKLWRTYRELLEKVVELEPDHTAARLGLRHRQVEGRWLSLEELREFEEVKRAKARLGLVRWKGEWVPEEQAEAERGVEAEAERLERADAAAKQAQGLVYRDGQWSPGGGPDEREQLLAGNIFADGKWWSLEESLTARAESQGLVRTEYGFLAPELAGSLNLIRDGGTIESGKMIAASKLIGMFRSRQKRFNRQGHWLTVAESTALDELREAERPFRSWIVLFSLVAGALVAGAVTHIVRVRVRGDIRIRMAVAAGCWLVLLLALVWFLYGGVRKVRRAKDLLRRDEFGQAVESCHAALRWRAGVFAGRDANARDLLLEAYLRAGEYCLDRGAYQEARGSLSIARALARKGDPRAGAAREALVRCHVLEAAKAREGDSYAGWAELIAAAPASTAEEAQAVTEERMAGYQEWSDRFVAQQDTVRAGECQLMAAVLAARSSEVQAKAREARKDVLLGDVATACRGASAAGALYAALDYAAAVGDVTRTDAAMDLVEERLGRAGAELMKRQDWRSAALAWLLYLSRSGEPEVLAARQQEFQRCAGLESDAAGLAALQQALPPNGELAFAVKKQLASIHFGEAKRLIREGRVDAGVEVCRRSLENYASQDVRREFAELCLARAKALAAAEKFAPAAETCRKAGEFYNSTGVRQQMAEHYLAAALGLAKEEHFADAAEACLNSLEAHDSKEARAQICSLYIAAAKELIDEERGLEAAELCRRSLKFCDSAQMRHRIGGLYLAEARKLRKGRNLGAARDAYRKCLEVYDTQEVRREMERFEVESELAQIRLGAHADMPKLAARSSGGRGPAILRIRNDTGYELTLFYAGLQTLKQTVGRSDTITLRLPPGRYEVGGRVQGPNVLPYYGQQAYAGGTQYESRFSLAPVGTFDSRFSVPVVPDFPRFGPP